MLDLGGEGGSGGGGNTDIRSRATAIQFAQNDINQGNITFNQATKIPKYLMPAGLGLLGLFVVSKMMGRK